MGFSKTHATSILEDVFKKDNMIALFESVNTDTDAYTEMSGTGYKRYSIKGDEFNTSKGITTTVDNLLYGLAEGDWGTCVGIGVFSGSGSLLYLASLAAAKYIAKDTVPVFKRWNESTKDGLKITLDVVTAGTVSVNDAS